MEAVIPESVPNGIITFPMLGEGFSFSPAPSFEVFGLTIHWYGVIIAIGFILAYLYVNHLVKKLGLTSDDLIDFLLCAVPAGIIGSRIYYVAFNYDMFRGDFLSVFKIWNGGLAIYGSIIGAGIALLICARVKKIPFAPVLDAAGPGFLIGQIVGRWGNFMNREAFGGATDIFCRMGLTDPVTNETIYVHPTFLYESLWNLIGFLIIHLLVHSGKRKYDGQIFAIYIAWYGFGRMFIEGLRTDSLYLFGTGLRVSQVLAGITCLAAVIYLCWNGSRLHSPEDMFVNIRKAREAESTEPDKEPAESAEV